MIALRHKLPAQKLKALQQGFTLVEMMVAMTILSLGLLSIAGLLLTATTMNSLGKSTNEALSQARDKMEHLKTYSEGAAERAVGGSLASDMACCNDTVGNYKRRWEIAAGPGTTRSYTVMVIPLTTDGRRNKTVTLTTIF